MRFLKTFLFQLSFIGIIFANDYADQRKELLDYEYSQSLLGDFKLTSEEQQASDILKQYSLEETYGGITAPEFYAATQPVFDFLNQVEASKVFQIIKKIPKAAVLHVHSIGMSSAEFIKNITHRDNLYVCDEENQPYQLKFFRTPDDTCNWISVAQKRKQNPFYDQRIQSKISYKKPYPYVLTYDINMEIRLTVAQMVAYKDVYSEYIYATYSDLYEDGVSHFEVRGFINELYDLDGNTYDLHYMVSVYKKQLAKFRKDHRCYFSVRLIYTIPRAVNEEELQEHLQIYNELRNRHGDFIIGVDFDGDEDYGKPLKDLADGIIAFRKSYPLDLFLHAGVTAWYGVYSDENLADAILLKAKRVAHSFALVKHPVLMQKAKEQDICVEVAPLSDHFHGLYNNIHNHVAAIFGANNMPYVVTNGNPGLYAARGVNYDWYLAYQGFASARDDLGFFKKLALNSIKYSGLSDKYKRALTHVYLKQWQEFVHKLINGEII